MMYASFFLIKYIAAFIAYYIGLDLFFNATVTEVLSFSLLTTIISFVLVDRMILPRFGKMDAAISDFLLAYMIVWVFGNIFLTNYLQIAWGSIISATLITISEVFVHRYIRDDLFSEGTYTYSTFKGNMAYGSEISDEKELESDYSDKE